MQPAFRVDRDPTTSAPRRVRVSGRLQLADGESLWERLREELRDEEELELDLSGVERMDGASTSILMAARAEILRSGGSVAFTGADEHTARLLDLYGCPTGSVCLKPAPGRKSALDQIGRFAAGLFSTLVEVLGYLGDLVDAAFAAVRHPRTVQWRDVGRLMEKAGADGLAITLLINFLIGLIMALQAAEQLRRFGANIFVADLVGLSVTRELAPLMTAIIVAGRSGAAYAAELGTMRVSEEIDALKTLGLDPYRFLVFPRVLALALVVPLLTVVSGLVGCLGGLIIAVTSLDLTMVAYVNELSKALDLWDVFGGVFKSVVFAVAITLISCERGLATRGGAAGVGASTTSAVVVILFTLVVLDALFTALFSLLGI